MFVAYVEPVRTWSVGADIRPAEYCATKLALAFEQLLLDNAAILSLDYYLDGVVLSAGSKGCALGADRTTTRDHVAVNLVRQNHAVRLRYVDLGAFFANDVRRTSINQATLGTLLQASNFGGVLATLG